MENFGEVSKENSLRKLARDFYNLTLYHRSKEISGIRLFENETDFTQLQVLYLHYLENISNLYLDLSLGEDLISEQVIEDFIRAESYLLYKRKKREDEKINKVVDNTKRGTDSIVFIPKRNKGK